MLVVENTEFTQSRLESCSRSLTSLREDEPKMDVEVIPDERLEALIDWIECPPHPASWRDIAAALRELQQYRKEYGPTPNPMQ